MKVLLKRSVHIFISLRRLFDGNMTKFLASGWFSSHMMFFAFLMIC